MASATKVLKARRAIRKAALGKKRKAKIRANGSVQANLPLDKPTANEKAQKSKKA